METSQTLGEEAAVSYHFTLCSLYFPHPPSTILSNIFSNQLLAHFPAWSAIIIKEKEKDI